MTRDVAFDMIGALMATPIPDDPQSIQWARDEVERARPVAHLGGKYSSPSIYRATDILLAVLERQEQSADYQEVSDND